MVYTFDYNDDYDPSMPVVEVGLGPTRDDIRLTLSAIVDSGADVSLMPRDQLRRLDILPTQRKLMRGVVGRPVKVRLYPVFVRLGGFSTYALVVGAEPGAEAIIGRDILNRLIVTLNGLAGVVEVGG